MLEELEKYARQNYIPVLLEDTKDLLLKTIKEYNPKTILEIGTAVGYSGTLMLTSCNAVLTTIELEEKNIELAKTTFTSNNVYDRVNQLKGDAKDVIKTLNTKYDFIFLDGPKGQYINYLPYLKNLLNDGGIIFADNVLYRGMVESTEFIPHKKRTIVVNLRKYLNEVTNSPDLDTTIYHIGDGIAISKKINTQG